MPRVRITKVVCGRSKLERALGQSLAALGIDFPDGNLVIDKAGSEIRIARGLALSEPGPFIDYMRHYPSQAGFHELTSTIDRELEAAYRRHLDEPGLCRPFKRCLVGKMYFEEKALFRTEAAAKAAIVGSVSSEAQEDMTEEQDVYSVQLDEAYIEEIDKVGYKKAARSLSSRQEAVPCGESSFVAVGAFLRAVGVRPARRKHKSAETYANLEKCCSYLTDVTFRSTDLVYVPADFSFFSSSEHK